MVTHSIGMVLVLLALTDIMQTKVLLIASAILSLVIFIVSFPITNRKFLSQSMFFIVVLLITATINLFFTQNNFGGSLTLAGNLFLAFLYIQFNDKKITPWVIGAYATTLLFIAYHLFVLGTHENFIYQGLSRNHAGFAVIFYTIFLLFHIKVHYNFVSLIPPIIALVLSFFLVGRTSLIVSAMLFAVVFFYKFKNNQQLRYFAIVVCIVFCFLLWSKYGSDLISETNLDAGLDTPRWKLWAIYWEHIDFANLLTGVDVTKLPMYDQYSGNPHNSFIKFHSRTGLGSIIFLGTFSYALFKYVQQRQYYILWLLLLLTLRASFDGDMFIGNFDFIFLIVTFYWLKADEYGS